MASENTVLSLNPDRHGLLALESVLREGGFEVVSVNTPLLARFEIEMGRCGIFLTSFLTPSPIYRDLASLFRRYCPTGLVIFMARQPDDPVPDADIILSDQDDPSALLKNIQSKQATKEN
jgi:hypothetical protein